MDAVRENLQYICSNVIPSKSFQTAMISKGLLDAAAISAFKDKSVSPQQEIALWLLHLSSKKSHSIQDFIELVQSTQTHLKPDQVKQMKKFMKEGWEVFREQVIKVLLSLIHTEVATHHEEQMKSTQDSHHKENVVPRQYDQRVKELEKEIHDLLFKVDHLKTQLRESRSKNSQEKQLLAYNDWKKHNKPKRAVVTQTESISCKDIDTMTERKVEISREIQTTLSYTKLDRMEQNMKMMEARFRKLLDKKSQSTQTEAISPKKSKGEEMTKIIKRPKTAPTTHKPKHLDKKVGSVKSVNPDMTDSGSLQVDEDGGTLNLSNSSFTVPQNSVDGHVTMNAATYLPLQEQFKELEQGDVSSFIRPGKRIKVATTPPTSVDKILVRSKIPIGAEYQTCSLQSFVLHKTRKRQAETIYEDVTNVCQSRKAGADMVEYTIKGCGEYQEYWIIQLQQKDLEIQKLKERLSNLRNLGVCMCDFTVFIPPAPPVNRLYISATNQDLKRRCPKIKELRQDNMIEIDNQPSSRPIHHKDLLVFRNEQKKAVMLRMEVDMIDLKAKGQNFQLPLGRDPMPLEVSILHYPLYDVIGEKDPWQLCLLNLCASSPRSPESEGRGDLAFRKCLQDHWCTLVENLDASSVLNHLYQNNIITERQKNEVQTKIVKEERNEKLLGILMTVGKGGFIIFCSALRQSKGSEWIADELSK